MVLGQITKIKTNFSTRVARPKLSINDFTTPARACSQLWTKGVKQELSSWSFLFILTFTLWSRARFRGPVRARLDFLPIRKLPLTPPPPNCDRFGCFRYWQFVEHSKSRRTKKLSTRHLRTIIPRRLLHQPQ